MIEVVSAVIVRKNRILLTQRLPTKDYPFMWESPGGKVEKNEDPGDALTRELREELGPQVYVIGNRVDVVEVGGLFRVSFFAVDVWHAAREQIGPVEPAVTNMEGQGLGWFTTGEMITLPLVPGNRLALGKIVERVRAKR